MRSVGSRRTSESEKAGKKARDRPIGVTNCPWNPFNQIYHLVYGQLSPNLAIKIAFI